MIRTFRMAAVVLTAAMLSGCTTSPVSLELKALQGEQIADLSGTSVAGSIHKEKRYETEADTTFGKPVYAKIQVTYTVTGEPAATFEKIKTLAVTEGWSLREPTDTIFGTTVRGYKPVGKRLTGDLVMTFIPPRRDTPTGGRGPAVITVLRARPR